MTAALHRSNHEVPHPDQDARRLIVSDSTRQGALMSHADCPLSMTPRRIGKGGGLRWHGRLYATHLAPGEVVQVPACGPDCLGFTQIEVKPFLDYLRRSTL